jgi:ribosome-associated protein
MSSTAGAEPRRKHSAGAVPLSSHELALAAARETLKKKADDVVILDLRTMTSVCDFFVIASGSSETQVKAIADQVSEGLAERGEKVWHTEGYQALKWVLLDYVDVVVHIFHQETRTLYQLERLWADAAKENLADD